MGDKMMDKKLRENPIESCVLIFLLCTIARVIEYFAIRTDETILAENLVHKVFGIVVLAVVIRNTKISWEKIGFKRTNSIQGVVKGLALGTICFWFAYLLEFLMLFFVNGNAKIVIYASGFSLNGEMVKRNGNIFIILCIVFNIINVWMEEGIFRGLFHNLLADRLSFKGVAVFSALLFGAWHWIMPMRDFIEGNSTLGNLLVMGIGYIVLAGIMSIKWSILYKMTGSLWMGLGDHLFNNVVVTNLLHVISNNQADSMQIVRVLIGQLLSFGLVMVCYKKERNFKLTEVL